ncbi:DnaJ-domain-containing protein [Ramicandelaber brevisporus]|nr:DnaJ-domain-containing protein [Ramicandelaber brevisporus]
MTDSTLEFATDDLYETLGVAEDASADDIKRAYRLLALRHHPDRLQQQKLSASALAAATKRFQAISFAYAILSDETKRARYDRTGSTADLDLDLDAMKSGKEWDAYFEELWNGVVSAQTIEEFSRKYKGSEEESRDVVEAYKNSGDGSLTTIMEHVPLASSLPPSDDEARFVEIINGAIARGEVETLLKWKDSSSTKAQKKRRREAEAEALQAELLAKELGYDKVLRGEMSKKDAAKQRAKQQKQKKQKKNGGRRAKADSEDEEEEEDDDDYEDDDMEDSDAYVDDDGNDDEFSQLRTLIKRKQTARMDALMNRLENKYGAKGKRSDDPPPPTDEEFEKIQAKLFGNKKKSTR